MSFVDMPLEYSDGDTTCVGHYYKPERASESQPVVLVTPAWDGVVGEVHDKACRLAEAGYIAMVVDVYGNGLTLDDMSQMEGAVAPLMTDRRVLVRRMQAAVAAAKTIPGADTHRIGAMGYCFGGLCVLDLARGGGEDVRAVVTFHGALIAPEPAIGEQINASILVLHGEDDPMVPPEQVAAFKQEMTEIGVDWQLLSYSDTVHAFTRPDANLPEMGAVYNERSDRRSWAAMLSFFEETLA